VLEHLNSDKNASHISMTAKKTQPRILRVFSLKKQFFVSVTILLLLLQKFVHVLQLYSNCAEVLNQIMKPLTLLILIVCSQKRSTIPRWKFVAVVRNNGLFWANLPFATNELRKSFAASSYCIFWVWRSCNVPENN